MRLKELHDSSTYLSKCDVKVVLDVMVIET
jgi:hypothetical protein